MKKVLVVAFDGCQASSLAGTLDILKTANQAWRSLNESGSDEVLMDWRVVSPGGRMVKAGCGLAIGVDGRLEDESKADLVFIPAMNVESGEDVTDELIRLSGLISWLKRMYQSGSALATGCSGSFLLADTGYLDGHSATTSWWLNKSFRKRYPNIDLKINQVVNYANRIYTAGAGVAYLNLMLKVVEEFGGQNVALFCAKNMLIDANKVSQSPYMMLQDHLQHKDEVVGKAQSWIQEHLHEDFTIQQLADYVSVSQRTFIRRFKKATGETPISYLQKLRIETAKKLLETTDISLETIVEQVGYADLSSFRRLFKRETDLSPRDYRQRYSINGVASVTPDKKSDDGEAPLAANN